LPDETLLALISLIESVCSYVIATEDIREYTESITNENHEQ